jgi:uncharacterized protein (DUF1330 family)
MPAYVISDVTVLNAEAFELYRNRAADSIAKHGGRYLARGGGIEPLEGDWAPRSIIIVEFPDIEQARNWYYSPEYASALQYWDAALTRNLILVDGIKNLSDAIAGTSE